MPRAEHLSWLVDSAASAKGAEQMPLKMLKPWKRLPST